MVRAFSGAFTFSTVNPTLDHITFSFFGSTAGAGPGSFSIDLGHFHTIDGETITGVSHLSGGLGGAITGVTWNGTDAIFTWTTRSNYNAIGGNFVTFDVNTTTPLPAALPLFATGLGGLGFLGWRRKRKAQALIAA